MESGRIIQLLCCGTVGGGGVSRDVVLLRGSMWRFFA